MATAQILVVDDEDSILRLMTFLLKSAGYNVSTAKNGETALEKIKSNAYELIVLDYMMPRIDGYHILKIVKNQYPQTGVIIVTGKGDENVAVDLMKAGADDYVTKPFEGPKLVETVKRVLEIRKKRINQASKVQKTKELAFVGSIATGVNEDVTYQGVHYHIQTEDMGKEACIIRSTVFAKGIIVAKREVDYRKVAQQENLREIVTVLVRRLHKYMRESLLNGQFKLD
ncbi:MAG: response regulator [Gemmatimonadetes bacterium]|nr:MAG: response regulator [Gemmatimonadota bacterium]